MKKVNIWVVVFLSFCILIIMSACEQDITIGSTVHDDGSIDRTIVLYDADSNKVRNNILGVNEARGWEIVIEPILKTKNDSTKKTTNTITFKKRFTSAADANQEMNRTVDTLFQIRSSYEKKNRWFYTYLEYSDTYHSLDRFTAVLKEDYFTREDYAFIDRLPPEGKPITKSDSLYLARLNEKIFEFYGTRTIFEELFQDMLITLREFKVAPEWEDSLLLKKEDLYQKFVKESGIDNEFLSAADFLKIPMPAKAREAIRHKSHEMENRMEFVSEAYSSKYLHIIRMPWPIVYTNADSVHNGELFWNPPVIKFLLNDYTMTARARKMNGWAVAVSVAIIFSTVALFVMRMKKINKPPHKPVRDLMPGN